MLDFTLKMNKKQLHLFLLYPHHQSAILLFILTILCFPILNWQNRKQKQKSQQITTTRNITKLQLFSSYNIFLSPFIFFINFKSWEVVIQNKLLEIFNVSLYFRLIIIMNFLLKLLGCEENPQIPLPILKHKTTSQTTSSEDFTNEMWIRKTQHIHSKFDYRLIKLLGEGAGGKVYLAQAINPENKKSQGKVAIKILSKSKLEQHKNYKKYLILQKRVHSEVKTTFTIKFIECFQSKSNCFIVLQYASGGSIFTFLHHKRRRTFQNNLQQCVKFIIGCVVLGLKSLHQSKFAYRDLKPENLLITEDGYVKIADFGLAEQFEQGKLIYGCKCGTVPYLAPEMVLRQGHNRLVDLWCLGVLTFQLLTKKIPFSEKQINSKSFKEIAENASKTFKFLHKDISKVSQDFISRLLKPNMEDRLGAGGYNQIMDHLFFKGFDWMGLSRHEISSPLLNVLSQPLKIIPKSHQCSSTDEDQNQVSFKNVSHFTTEGSPVKRIQCEPHE